MHNKLKFFTVKISFPKAKKISFWLAFVFVLGLLNAYLFFRYNIGSREIEKITFESNIDKSDLLLYANSERNPEIDFTKPVFAKGDSNVYVFDLRSLKLRQYRIYLGAKHDSVFLGTLHVYYEGSDHKLNFSEFELHGIQKRHFSSEAELWFQNEPNAYLEFNSEVIEMWELCNAELLILIIAYVISVFAAILFKDVRVKRISFFRIKIVSVYIFLFSIFLPLPVFNITFMFSLLLVIKDFDYRRLLGNKLALLFMLYFVFFIFNNLFISHAYNPKITETMLPFLFLPFYFACLPKINYLPAFPIAGFLISIYFLATASIDLLFYHHLSTFSFDSFTKYIHPVYFSYLLFFSICYLEIKESTKNRNPLVFAVLLTALLCCGSKLVIGLVVLFYTLKYFKKSMIMGLAVMGLLIVGVLLFPPTRTRFIEIVSMKNITILSENPIKNSQDTRLNGLTLRLIIWQESLKTLESSGDFTFGKGVDQHADKTLENRLLARGLEVGQTKYDPHNQLITTFYKMGMLGLGVLLIVCIYVYRRAIRSKDRLLLYSIILFSAAMLTESILQRVVGIYFFISILLLLSIPVNRLSKKIENSDTRN